jgi:hypothetical protein
MTSELLDRLYTKRQKSGTDSERYWAAINLVKKLISIPGCTETRDPDEDIYHLSYKNENLLMVNLHTTEIQPCVMIRLIHSYNEQDAALIENPLSGIIPAFCKLTGSPLAISDAWWCIIIGYLMSKYPETRKHLMEYHGKVTI